MQNRLPGRNKLEPWIAFKTTVDKYSLNKLHIIQRDDTKTLSTNTLVPCFKWVWTTHNTHVHTEQAQNSGQHIIKSSVPKMYLPLSQFYFGPRFCNVTYPLNENLDICTELETHRKQNMHTNRNTDRWTEINTQINTHTPLYRKTK